MYNGACFPDSKASSTLSLWPGCDSSRGEYLAHQQAGEGAATPLPSKSEARPAGVPVGRGRGFCLLAPGQLGQKAVRPPTLAPSFPAPGPPGPLTTEPEPDGSQPRDQPHSPVRRETPSSHLKTPPTSRLFIGSRISANGVGPFWPLNCHGNRPRSAPLLNPLKRVIRSFLLFFSLSPFSPFFWSFLTALLFLHFLPYAGAGLDLDLSSFHKEGE